MDLITTLSSTYDHVVARLSFIGTGSTYTTTFIPAVAPTPIYRLPPPVHPPRPMNVQLQSTNVSLLLDYADEASAHELWRMLKRTAVEPGQSTAPDIVSFADECLLCAQIAVNFPPPSPAFLTAAEDDPGHATQGENVPGSPPNPFLRPSSPRVPESRRIGFVYLLAGPANYPAQEANIGVIVKESVRGHGYAREAVQLVLGWAFEELKFHRVQAAILDTPTKDSALRLFVGAGFVHEGTKRRSVYQPEGEGMAGVWKDVTYLAMLDTEWTLQSTWRRHNQNRAVTLWDEMFSRHAREQEELLRWEEKHKQTKKSSSMETLREHVQNAVPDLAYLTDDASSFGEPSRAPSVAPLSGPNLTVTWQDDSEMEDAPDEEDPFDEWDAPVSAQRLSQHLGIGFLHPLSRERILSLASIPSTTRRSEAMPQSPVTIPTFSTPGSSPPPSPSSVGSSPHSPWLDSEDEELPNRASASTLQAQLETPRGPFLRPVSVRSRPRSHSVSSTSSYDSWSDAQSSVDGSWDVISNTSAHSPREHV